MALLSKKMQDAINQQINRELYSAYLYLAMASHLESENLSGFANWMEIQAKEETEHAMKFYKYINERGGRVILKDVEAPPAAWKSPLEVFEQVYEHEKKVTSLINNLMKMAKAENDYASESMLKWFIDEQVEEEDNALTILEQLKMARGAVNLIFQIDRALGKRKDD
ncbi:MAG: ferritin [Spirochaetes bacterium]|nr:ferritin [Spirochaetota bacterium]